MSPDGRWMAYVSTESGDPQVYVQAYPAGVPRHQISADGGISPVWRRDGREIFYMRQNAAAADRSPGTVSIMSVRSQSLQRSHQVFRENSSPVLTP